MGRNSAYYRNLIATVLRLSESNEWESAVNEWCIEGVEEDETLAESCVCGKEELRYLFTIRNTINESTLSPIGSSCIKKFERTDLNEEIAVKIKLFKLLHAIEKNKFLTLSAELFSRKLLRHLYDVAVFKASRFNNFDPYNDYQFMLDMFNKCQRRTEKEDKRVSAIILNSIKPSLRQMLNKKIRRKNEKEAL